MNPLILWLAACCVVALAILGLALAIAASTPEPRPLGAPPEAVERSASADKSSAVERPA